MCVLKKVLFLKCYYKKKNLVSLEKLLRVVRELQFVMYVSSKKNLDQVTWDIIVRFLKF